MGGLCGSAFYGRSAEIHESPTVLQSTVGLQLNDKPQTWKRLNAPTMHMEGRTIYGLAVCLYLLRLEKELRPDATPGNVNKSCSASI